MLRNLCSVSLRRFYHKSPHTVTIPSVPIAEFILRDFDKYRNLTALTDGLTGRAIKFGQLQEEVDNAAGGFYKLGLRKSDVVCLYASNAIEFAHVLCGVTSTGGILTIANSQMTPGELTRQLQQADAKFVVTTPDCAERAKEATRNVPGIKEIIVIGEADGCRPFSELLDSNSSPCPKVDINPQEDVALLPYSSGITGLPKGVMLTHHNLVAQLCQLRHPLFLPMKPGEDTSISVLPMVHIGGLVIGLFNPLAQGANVVTLPKFEPDSYLRAIQEYRGTFGLLAPPLVNFFAKHPLVDQYDISTFRQPYSGAAALGKDLTNKMVKRLGIDTLRQGFGMSEASPVTHTTPWDGWKYGSIGKPLPNTESKIVDPDTLKTLGPNEQGEVWVRGPQIMKGYLQNPTATKETITDDLWLRTGDIGYFDEDGEYFIADKLKEMIKYKGYQVPPAELEDTLMSHPQVRDAAVIGVPDEVVGEFPRAFVVLQENATIKENELIDYVADRVSPHKLLRGGLEFVTEIPKAPSGKILRRLHLFYPLRLHQKKTQLHDRI